MKQHKEPDAHSIAVAMQDAALKVFEENSGLERMLNSLPRNDRIEFARSMLDVSSNMLLNSTHQNFNRPISENVPNISGFINFFLPTSKSECNLDEISERMCDAMAKEAVRHGLEFQHPTDAERYNNKEKVSPIPSDVRIAEKPSRVQIPD